MASAAARICPPVLWLTGLSGAGKTTIGSAVVAELTRRKVPAELLDGDEIRRGVGRFGFDREGRDTQVALVGYLASRLQRHGIAVVVCLISPYEAARQRAAALCDPFVLVYLNTPLAECEKRDPKGLYAQARFGLIPRFTGVTDPYEPPEHPHLVIDTSVVTSASAASTLVQACLQPPQGASSSRTKR